MNDATTTAPVSTATPAAAPAAAPTTAPATEGGGTGVRDYAAQAAASADGTPTAQPTDMATATEAQQQAARVELAKLAPDTQVVMVIDGAEVVMSAAEAMRKMQRPVAAEQRFRDAARLKREADEMRASLARSIQDPALFRQELAAMGIDTRQWAEQIHQAEIAELTMTPDQRRIRELERQQAEYQRQVEAQRQAQIQALAAQNQAAYTAKFHEIMDSAGIPKVTAIREEILPLMAHRVEQALRASRDPYSDPSEHVASPQLLAQLVREYYQSRTSAYAEAIDPSLVLKRMTKEQLLARIAELEGQPAPAPQPAAPAPAARPTIPGVKPSSDVDMSRDERGRYAQPERAKPRIYRSGSTSSYFGRDG